MDILFHLAESGIAQMLQPLIKTLQMRGDRLYFDLHKGALNYLSEELEYKKSNLSLINLDNVKYILFGFDSISQDLTGKFLEQVKVSNAKKIGFLDSWKGADRFWSSNGNLRELGDVLLVPCLNLKNYLIDKGLKDIPIITIKHPIIFPRYKPKRYSNKLLILSEPILNKEGRWETILNRPHKSGTTVLDYLKNSYKDEFEIFLRMHPVEKISNQEGVNIDKAPLFESISNSSKVIGFTTTALFYSKKLDVPTESIVYQLDSWNPKESNIPETLWNTITQNSSNLPSFKDESGASLLELIEEI